MQLGCPRVKPLCNHVPGGLTPPARKQPKINRECTTPATISPKLSFGGHASDVAIGFEREHILCELVGDEIRSGLAPSH